MMPSGYSRLPLAVFGAAFALLGAAAPAATASPADPAAQSAPPGVPAQMTFQNGDAYRGTVLVTPQAPIPNQPQNASVTFDDRKARSGYVVPDGLGQLSFDGYTLNATFARGYANGKGTLSGPGGFRLDDGTFVNGAATSGTLSYGDGSRYAGGLQNGCLAGNGTYHSKIGAVASGTWLPVASADGATCVGSRLAGGHVRMNGTRYEGPLDIAGKPDGKGVFADRHGRKVAGTWSHGLYAGVFTQTSPAGRQESHVAVTRPSASLDGPGTWYSLDGSRAYGNFRNGALEGPATLVDAFGKRHAGGVSDGRFTSSDRTYAASLEPYKGFKGPRDALGRPDGVGSLPYYDSSGGRVTSVVRGRWRHGVMTGFMKARVAGSAAAPTFLVKVDPPGNELRGPARLTFPRRNYWEEGTFSSGALNGRGSVRFTNQPACRLEGVFRAGVMRSATKICAGDPPYDVEIASDGSIR